MWPIPFIPSMTTQSHAKNMAEGQSRLMGQSRHQNPNAANAQLMMMNPRSGSDETRPTTKAAGANDSQSRPTYSSIECAAWVAINRPNVTLDMRHPAQSHVLESVRRESSCPTTPPRSEGHFVIAIWRGMQPAFEMWQFVRGSGGAWG